MTDFRELAACRKFDPETWFPVGTPGAPAYEAQLAEARAVCAGCPVRQACLEFALEAGLTEGVYGGLDGPERATLARGRVRVPSRVS